MVKQINWNEYILHYRVTIAKDKATHRSKGVAFILFVEKDSAYKAVRALNNTVVIIVQYSI